MSGVSGLLDKKAQPERSSGLTPFAVVPALISAAVCAALFRINALSFFFLAPLGFVAFSFNKKSAWLAAFMAFAINSLVAAGFVVFASSSRTFLLWNMASFVMPAVFFSWIVAPPNVPRLRLASAAYRIVVSAAVLFVASMLVIIRNADELRRFLESYAKAASSFYTEMGLAADSIDIEALVGTMLEMGARGGGLLLIVLFFFVNRQVSAAISLFSRRARPIRGVADFRADYRFVWALSLSLASVIIFRMGQLPFGEIIAWNVVIVCAILYLAQGIGLVLYFLRRPSQSAWMRLALTLLIVVMVMSPGVNIAALGGVLLLGLAENWVSFRDSDGSPSTPAA